jgi:diadenylate cyclase
MALSFAARGFCRATGRGAPALEPVPFSPRFQPCDKLAAVSEYLTGLLRRPPVGWWDLLDIAIVSIIVYEFLKLIRGTRAVQMAAGSLLLVGLFYVSRLAPLQTLNWMIRNMLVYVAFAAIVIFQSDIRRALAHFGQAPFFRYLTRQESANETIEELVVASTMLSSQRIGAIIAIEREIGLRNYIESGIPIDATLTYDLIVTIFQPKSPLHDGAVILQEGRIAAAACFLPLTVNPRVSRELGTRHRAAIGLTEENDAVAIVVSEERGQIALAINGRIDRDLSPDDLRERLKTFVVQRRGSGIPSSAYDA